MIILVWSPRASVSTAYLSFPQRILIEQILFSTFVFLFPQLICDRLMLRTHLYLRFFVWHDASPLVSGPSCSPPYFCHPSSTRRCPAQPAGATPCCCPAPGICLRAFHPSLPAHQMLQAHTCRPCLGQLEGTGQQRWWPAWAGGGWWVTSSLLLSSPCRAHMGHGLPPTVSLAWLLSPSVSALPCFVFIHPPTLCVQPLAVCKETSRSPA